MGLAGQALPERGREASMDNAFGSCHPPSRSRAVFANGSAWSGTALDRERALNRAEAKSPQAPSEQLTPLPDGPESFAPTLIGAAASGSETPSCTPSGGAPLFAPGKLVAGRYRVTSFLAQGAMGQVYEAEDLELHEHVALKTLRPQLAADEQLGE